MLLTSSCMHGADQQPRIRHIQKVITYIRVISIISSFQIKEITSYGSFRLSPGFRLQSSHIAMAEEGMFEEVVVEEDADYAEAIGDISFKDFLALVPSHRLKPGVVNPWCKGKAAPPQRKVLKSFMKPCASAHPKDIKPFLNARTMPPSVMMLVPTCPQCRLEQKTGPMENNTVTEKLALPTPSRNKHLPLKAVVDSTNVIKPSEKMNFEAAPKPSQKA